MIARYLLCCMVLVMVIKLGVDACSCSSFSMHQRFCNNTLVIKGQVKKIKSFGSGFNKEIRYKVKVLGFKGSLQTLTVWTPGDVGICGIGADKNKVYIFAMNKNGNRWWLHQCSSWVELWSQLTTAEILGVNGVWNCAIVSPGK